MRKGGTTSSIRARLLAASMIILPVFLGLTVWGLDRAFASYQADSQRDSMRLQQLLLAKAADWDGSAWRFEGLDEARLQLPDSGLYAYVLNRAGAVLWRSPSAGQGDTAPDQLADRLLPAGLAASLALGDQRFFECAGDRAYYCYVTGIAWGSTGPESVFLIVEDQAAAIAARDAYRGTLVALAFAVAVLLLLAQAWVIRWGLLPLSGIASDIRRLGRGELSQLRADVPRELLPLTDSVNQLLHSERSRRERVRNTMDRLTHVLKTPLMLLRNSRDEGDSYRQLVQEQVGRMLGIVEGELARAKLDGKSPQILAQSVPVRPVLSRIASAYQRLPRMPHQGELQLDTTQIDADAAFAGEERDLQDLFGSLLENSLKYCESRIEVSASVVDNDNDDGCWLHIAIADDGEGIPPGLEKDILRRGARADTASVGQGLGLSIVVEIVSAYGGSLHSDRSPLGGALFTVRLPGQRV